MNFGILKQNAYKIAFFIVSAPGWCENVSKTRTLFTRHFVQLVSIELSAFPLNLKIETFIAKARKEKHYLRKRFFSSCLAALLMKRLE